MKKVNAYWNPCMCSKAWNNRSSGLLILSLLIFGWAIVVSAYIAIAEEGFASVVAILVVITFGVAQLLYFSFLYVIEKRKYRMNEEGITVLYGGRIQKFYPWAAFTKIVVCDFDHASKYPSNCFLVIRLASLEEAHGPHSQTHKYTLAGIETWRGYHYTMRNFTKIIFLEYSPALLNELVYFSELQVMLSLTKYGKDKMETHTTDDN